MYPYFLTDRLSYTKIWWNCPLLVNKNRPPAHNRDLSIYPNLGAPPISGPITERKFQEICSIMLEQERFIFAHTDIGVGWSARAASMWEETRHFEVDRTQPNRR
jgi:hypothetical protein